KRDDGFAERLKQRDESVLFDIDRAYASPLRRLLTRATGRCFDNADVEDILDLALAAVWMDYDPDSSASVRTFYFNVARLRLLDRFKTNGRYLNLLQRVKSRKTHADVEDRVTPDVEFFRVERRVLNAEIKALIDRAMSSLTARQRLACMRRFAS